MVWGAEGTARSWIWPPEAEIGARGDLVADIISHDAESALVSLFPCGTRALDCPFSMPRCWTKRPSWFS